MHRIDVRQPGYRLAASVAAALLLCAGMSGAVSAATFTTAPAVYSQTGGPFTFAFMTSGSQGSSGVSYKLSTEPAWHRCLSGMQSVSLGPVPEGKHTITIADDVNLGYYASLGLLYSGMTQPCQTTPPPDNLAEVPTTFTVIVDRTGPQVSGLSVEVAGKTIRATGSATDAVAGLDHVDWLLGDGSQKTTSTPQLDYSYLSYGTYSGRMRAFDKAGNVTEQSFTVSIPAPTVPTITPPIQAPANTTPMRRVSAGCKRRTAQLSTARSHEATRLRAYRRRHTTANRKRWLRARVTRRTAQRLASGACA